MSNLINNLNNNEYVRKDCIDTTIVSKNILLEIINQYGLKYEPVSDSVDIHDHIDCYLYNEKLKFSIDYKSNKFLLQDNVDTNFEWVWIEFKNVAGNAGWIYGKADCIVWVLKNELWFVNRKKLLDFVIKRLNIGGNKHTNDKKHAHYQWYKRLGRNDLITQISMRDIKNELNPHIFKRKLDFVSIQ